MNHKNEQKNKNLNKLFNIKLSNLHKNFHLLISKYYFFIDDEQKVGFTDNFKVALRAKKGEELELPNNETLPTGKTGRKNLTTQ
uniref:Uncharacterized protein n=1 Tax=Meloidogyne enterolobii TaxID=390850 RepID=A0A6V7TJ28_MELEN|nr:unnamed protein product [Meloidogyne enterolobii]